MNEKELAASLYNRAWELLAKPDRTEQESIDLERTAFASLYHWSQIGTVQNVAIGEWFLARMYATFGSITECLRHAKVALDLAESHEVPDWLKASAYEGYARALALAKAPEADMWRHKTMKAIAEIADQEDRDLIQSQFEEP